MQNKYVSSDEFKLNLNIACHSGTRLYCRSYHMNKKSSKRAHNLIPKEVSYS